MPKQPAHDRAPYPVMIIACIVTSMVLFLIVVGVLAFDTLSRADTARTTIIPQHTQTTDGTMPF